MMSEQSGPSGQRRPSAPGSSGAHGQPSFSERHSLPHLHYSHASMRPVIWALLMVFSWGSVLPILQIAEHYGLAAVPLASLRYVFAGLVMVFWLIVNHKSLPDRSDWLRLFLCSISGMTIYNICLNLGVEGISSATGTLILASCPIMAAIIGVAFAGDRLTRFGWIGSCLALAGVVVVSVSEGRFTLRSGAGLILMAAVLNAVYSVIQRPLIHKYGPGTALAYILAVGGFFLLPWFPQGLAQLRGSGPVGWTCVAELVFLPGIMGYICWGALVGELGAARAAIILYLNAPVTILMAVLLLNQWPGPLTLVGGAIVMAGLVVSRIRPRPMKVARGWDPKAWGSQFGSHAAGPLEKAGAAPAGVKEMQEGLEAMAENERNREILKERREIDEETLPLPD